MSNYSDVCSHSGHVSPRKKKYPRDEIPPIVHVKYPRHRCLGRHIPWSTVTDHGGCRPSFDTMSKYSQVEYLDITSNENGLTHCSLDRISRILLSSFHMVCSGWGWSSAIGVFPTTHLWVILTCEKTHFEKDISKKSDMT